MKLQATKIESYQHFVDLSNQFDRYYKTKTYISFLTLTEINKIFLQINPHMYLSHLINELFKKNKIVYSNEPWLNDSHIGKLNALSKIITDIRSGIGITSPISMGWFNTAKVAMHPGNTRLLLHELYHKQIPVVITDHNGNFLKKYSVKCFNLSEVETDTVIGLDFSVDNTSLPDSSGTYRKIAPPNTTFKELTDHCPFYSSPTLADPPRCYEVKDKKVYIDGTCYAVYSKKKWKLIL